MRRKRNHAIIESQIMESEIHTLYAKPECNTSPCDEKRHTFTKTTREELGGQLLPNMLRSYITTRFRYKDAITRSQEHQVL